MAVNVFQVFLLAAIKFYSHVSLFPPAQRAPANPPFFLGVIDACLEYGFAAASAKCAKVRFRRNFAFQPHLRPACLLNYGCRWWWGLQKHTPPFEFVLAAPLVRWLGLRAFVQILARKQTEYTAVVG